MKTKNPPRTTIPLMKRWGEEEEAHIADKEEEKEERERIFGNETSAKITEKMARYNFAYDD